MTNVRNCYCAGMDDLPMVKPLPRPPEPLTREDLVDMLTGLEPGYYLTRDLYPRYLAWAKKNHRDPVTVLSLGQSISRRVGLGWRRRSSQQMKMWHVTPEGLANDWRKL